LKRKIAIGLLLTLLLTSMLALVFNIHPAKSYYAWSENIYIRADGSITPTAAPISTIDNVTYTLTDNIVGNVLSGSQSIIIERNNTVLDGTGHTVQGTGSGVGLYLNRIGNVTIKNTNIKNFHEGIRVWESSGNSISENNIANNTEGVYLGGSYPYNPSNNSISGNNIANNGYGIHLWNSYNNIISGNNIKANKWYGIYPYYSENNVIYHNNFINNVNQALVMIHGNVNSWDDGYPSGGNYWSDYAGIDADGDGIGDTPYIINDNNRDRYPLMTPSEQAPPTPPEVQVGVKASDWIKVNYAITGWPAGTPYPLWLKMEFLSVQGTSVTVRVTMRMSDGTEQNATVPVDVVAGGDALGLSGLVIPANLTTGDVVYMSGYGDVTIEGETTKTYAGASRTVVYASVSQYGTQLTYYWDKQTGVMVEASTTSGGMTATAKATETNIWEATPGFPFDPIILSVLIAIVIVIATAILLMRRKKKPTEPPKPET